MANSGSRYFKIKIDTETGKIKKMVDENNTKATPVPLDEVNQIYATQGFTHVGTILHTHSSPGCVFVVIGGWAYKICSWPPPP